MKTHLSLFLLAAVSICYGQSVQIGGQVSVGGQIGIQVSGAPQFVITDSALPSGTFNTAYSHTVQTANGTAPITCTLISGPGDLPSGVTLASNCVLSGTPRQAGNF